ncbi:3979_t:CDS:2 [Funneliformis mosseae]|uniref:3979_t:CDS:1 n=1 Tax=Funneliformis mosseae TaxID=27381 RepID=A0A9N9CQR2_FUNMO|nr:3979_t:CDS:2 [Funneliformis mosseae]
MHTIDTGTAASFKGFYQNQKFTQNENNNYWRVDLVSLHHNRNTSAINPLDQNLHVNTQQSHSFTSRNPLYTLNSNEV